MQASVVPFKKIAFEERLPNRHESWEEEKKPLPLTVTKLDPLNGPAPGLILCKVTAGNTIRLTPLAPRRALWLDATNTSTRPGTIGGTSHVTTVSEIHEADEDQVLFPEVGRKKQVRSSAFKKTPP